MGTQGKKDPAVVAASPKIQHGSLAKLRALKESSGAKSPASAAGQASVSQIAKLRAEKDATIAGLRAENSQVFLRL